jgi:hypothetical protein
MFVRDDSAVGRILENLSHSVLPKGSFRVSVVDKTTVGLLDVAGDRVARYDLEVIPAPRNEPFFASWPRIQALQHEYVLQIHDDDTWVGTPVIGGGGAGVYASRLTLDSGSGPPSPMSLLFGAARSDLWNAFAEFILMFDNPDGTLDQAYCHLLHSVWREPNWVRDYTYLYDASDWSIETRARQKNERLSREMGWAGIPATITMPATARLNSLALAGFLLERRPELGSHLLPLPNSPVFRYSLTRFLPSRARVALAASRGNESGQRRAREFASHLSGNSARMVQLCDELIRASRAQSREEVDPLLRMLQAQPDLSIEGHLRVWSSWIR